MRDKEGEFGLDRVIASLFSPSPEDLDFGLTGDTLWLRFEVDNQSQKDLWILEFNIHKFYTTQVYMGKPGERPTLTNSWSYKQPFREREIREPELAFNLTIPTGEQRVVYLKVRSENSLDVPLVLYSSEAYFLKITRMKSLYSTIYAILIAMLVYNIFIYFFLRDRNYLYYVFYVFVYTIYLSALNGYGAQFLWPFVEGRWTTIFSAVFGGISLGVGCFLAREFLRTKELLPRCDRALKILAVLGFFLSLIVFLFENFMVSFIYGNAVGTVVLLGIFIITIISYARGYKPALYFFISYSTIIVAQILYSILSLGPFGEHFLLKNLNQYAAVIQMMLLSLSLSYRFDLMRRENDKAREIALKAEMTLASRLEQKVNERTRELKETNAKLKSLSQVDSLTGLYNRRYFEKTLKAEWKRLGREKLPLSVILCDIDHFKLYNDSLGHLAGDVCIQKIALILKETARRESDIPARFGGEEFLLILPQTDGDEVLHLARLIKDRVEVLQMGHPAFPGKSVTLSMGVATVIPSLESTAEELLEQADKALYRSKEEGRDRITFFSVKSS